MSANGLAAYADLQPFLLSFYRFIVLSKSVSKLPDDGVYSVTTFM